jgi:hypothetical protein
MAIASHFTSPSFWIGIPVADFIRLVAMKSDITQEAAVVQ